MHIDILTLFPEMFKGPFDESIIKRAREKLLVEINIHNIRDYSHDKHRTVDDRPFGGGPGMVLKPEPIFECIEKLKKRNSRVLFMTPQGKRFDQRMAVALSKEKHLIILCGHYEGVDERIRDALITDEISIGDYVLTSGVLPAMILVDAVVRLVPGVLGDTESSKVESFSQNVLDYPHYTRPEVYREMKVPDILRSGNHQQIEKWRKEKALERTKKIRPDLLKNKNGTD